MHIFLEVEQALAKCWFQNTRSWILYFCVANVDYHRTKGNRTYEKGNDTSKHEE